MKRKKYGKYSGIIAAIALFVVLVAAVLLANFQLAAQFARDTELVNLAARQQTLSQQTVKALLQTDNALGNGSLIDEPLGEFRQAFELFDQTLAAFLRGGQVTAADGSASVMAPLTDPELIAELQAAEQVWIEFRSKIMPIVEFDGTVERDADFSVGDEEGALEGAMYEAIVYSARQNVSAGLLTHMNAVAVSLERSAEQRASLLRAIQVAGIALALASFFIIVFYFLRNLTRSDEALLIAEREKDDILDTVQEGLFLLDSELTFGTQYSAAVETIFRREDLGGQSFVDLLREIVPEKTLETARDYVELFFGNRVNEKLVHDLNPLDQVEVHFKDESSGFVTRYLGFSFKRVTVDEDVSHLLVTVNDITEVVKLKRLLDQSQDQSKTQLDMLMDILHIEPSILNDFLSQADEGIDAINTALKKQVSDQSALQYKLDTIFRRVHSLKGEAGALGLTSIADLAHRIEDRVVALKDNKALTGSDFLPLTMRLDELMSHQQSVRKLVERLVRFRGALQSEAPPSDATGQPVDQRSAPRTDAETLFAGLAERMATEQQKKVELVCHGFDFRDVPELYRKAVKDMSVQFIRNGISHGIELPEERLQAQKGQQGRLFLSFQRTDGQTYELKYRDDGRGLCVDQIREAAVARGFVAADQIGSLNDRQAMSLIFKRGFSTARTVDGSAGRGVGMDVVRHLVHELGGRVQMSTSAGKYTAFTVTLPAQTAQSVEAA